MGRGMAGGGRGLGVIVAIVSVALCAAPSVGATGNPAIAVSPHVMLVSGQTVAVAGSGFAPGQPIGGVECLSGASDPSSCDLNTLVIVMSDGQGSFRTPFAVHRTMFTVSGLTDCATAQCEVLFALGSDFSAQATQSISFDPSVPLPPTSLHVTPSTRLTDRTRVTVVGGGFTAGHIGVVTECVSVPLSCMPSSIVPFAADGSFTIPFTLSRMLLGGTSSPVDCAAAPGTCELLAIDAFDVDYHAVAPLTFDPNRPPPPPPSATVRPNTDLPFYARTAVRGERWSTGQPVAVAECDTQSSASCDLIGIAFTNGRGGLEANPMLHRYLAKPFEPHAPPTDCAAPGRCVVDLFALQDGSDLTVPIAFAASAPVPPPPSASITPAGPFTHTQTVRIHGRSFAPLAAVSVSECAASAQVVACFSVIGPSQPMTDSTGSVTTDYTVHRRLEAGPDATLDCAAPGVQCTLQIDSEGGAAASVSLRFTAGAGADTSAPATASISANIRGGIRWAALAGSPCAESRPFTSFGAAPATPASFVSCAQLRRVLAAPAG